MAGKRNPAALMSALKRLKRPDPADAGQGGGAEPDLDDPTGEDTGDPGQGLPMEDPRNGSKDGQTIYVDENLFPGNCEVGDKYNLVCTVTSLGTKFGLQPEEATPVKDSGKPDDEDGDEYGAGKK